MNYYNRGEIWWVDLGDTAQMRESHIQVGFRPCLIVSNDINNAHSPTVNIVPLTLHSKELPVHVNVYLNGAVNRIMCEQIRTVPKSAIRKFICTVNEFVMKRVEDCIRIQLGMD